MMAGTIRVDDQMRFRPRRPEKAPALSFLEVNVHALDPHDPPGTPDRPRGFADNGLQGCLDLFTVWCAAWLQGYFDDDTTRGFTPSVVITTGLIVPSALNSICSIAISRWCPLVSFNGLRW